MPEANMLWNLMRFAVGKELAKPRHWVITSSAQTLKMIQNFDASIPSHAHISL